MNTNSYLSNGFRTCVLSTALTTNVVQAQAVEPDSDWELMVEKADGQTVHFNI